MKFKSLGIKLIFAILLLLGVFIRLSHLNFTSGLTYDELYSWKCATQTFPFGIVDFLIKTDYHPPLYYLILNQWMGLVGESDLSLELLTVLFSSATLWIVYLLGK